MWLTLFGVVPVMSLGFGLGSVLADRFERDAPLSASPVVRRDALR